MTKIMGNSVATASQMATYLLSKNSNPKFSRNISTLEFCQLYLDIAAKEGVRGDIAFAQMLKETGNMKFGGDVNYKQNNFAGIGATGGVPGNSFPTIEIGILAHVQHLKSYATTAPLNEPNVDPRRTNWFMSVKGGTSPDVETLGGSWAVPGYSTSKYKSLEAANAAKDSYGYQIVTILNNILRIKVTENTEKKYYRVQTGAYSKKINAIALQVKLKLAGFTAIIKQYGNLYKVQIGAYSKKSNAETMLEKVKAKGFNAFITYC